MRPKIKNSILRRFCLKESWMIFFFLGMVMLNYPFINIFNRDVLLLHIPLLFLYLMIGWGISIFVVFLFVKSQELCKEDEPGEGEQR